MLKWIKSLFSKEQEDEPNFDYMTVWGVIEGPQTDDEGETWFLVIKASIDDEVFITNVYFDTFPEAYQMEKHFKTNFDPIKIPIGVAKYD
jgi:hypothetical protein